MKPLIKKILFFNIALDIIILDQISKWFVTEHLIRTVMEKPEAQPINLFDWLVKAPEKLPYTSIEILPVFNLVMVWNTGISFGIFSEGTSITLLIVLPLCITVIFAIWLARTDTWVKGTAIALVIGGAIGNIIDRARFGAVIDFLDFHIGDLHYPAFNLADSCVVIGIGLLIVYSLFCEKRPDA